MAETPPSRDTDEILSILDSWRSPRNQNSAFTIDDLSSMAMLASLGEQYEVVQARFTGQLPAAHAIGVREATTILGALQEVVSEVGATLRNESPKRGPLPSSILKETELQLSPQIAPGSVIFAMNTSRDEALFDASTLLADALSEVFALFDQVELPASNGGTPDSVADSLRRFGPRTAQHLVRFAGALREHSLNLDVGIARSGAQIRGSRISASGAGFLKSLAENATKRTSEIEIVGEVHSLGKDHRYRINTADRGKITVRGTDAVTDVLQVAFRHSSIKLAVLETEAINLATGAVSYSFEALGAEVYAAD
jgi:hypothetical protein